MCEQDQWYTAQDLDGSFECSWPKCSKWCRQLHYQWPIPSNTSCANCGEQPCMHHSQCCPGQAAWRVCQECQQKANDEWFPVNVACGTCGEYPCWHHSECCPTIAASSAAAAAAPTSSLQWNARGTSMPQATSSQEHASTRAAPVAAKLTHKDPRRQQEASWQASSGFGGHWIDQPNERREVGTSKVPGLPAEAHKDLSIVVGPAPAEVPQSRLESGPNFVFWSPDSNTQRWSL